MSERPDQPVEEEMAIPEGGGEDHMDVSCHEESNSPGYVSLKSKGPGKPINIRCDEKLYSFSHGIQANIARSLSRRDHDQISEVQAELGSQFKDQSAEFLDKRTGQSAHYDITKSIVECNEDMSERPEQPLEEKMAIPEGGGEDHMDVSCHEESDPPGYVSLKSKGPGKPINIRCDEKLYSFSHGIQANIARSLSRRDHDQISEVQAELGSQFKDQSAEFLDKRTGQSAHYDITKSIVECNEDMSERPEQPLEEKMAIPEGGGEDHMDVSCHEESDPPGYVSLKSKGPGKPINIRCDEKLYSFNHGIQANIARSLSRRDHDQISEVQAELGSQFKVQSAEFLDKSTGQTAHYDITKSIVECNGDMSERPEQPLEEKMAIPEGDATRDENAVGEPKPDLPTALKSVHTAEVQVNEATGTRGNEAERKLENFMRKAETELCIDKTRVTERKPTRPEPLTNEKVIEKPDTESKSDSEYIANLEKEIELLQKPQEIDRQVEERKKLEEDKKKKEEEKRKIEMKKLEDKKTLDENRKKKEEYRKRKEEEDKKKREEENKKIEEERMRREKEEADKREKEETVTNEKDIEKPDTESKSDSEFIANLEREIELLQRPPELDRQVEERKKLEDKKKKEKEKRKIEMKKLEDKKTLDENRKKKEEYRKRKEEEDKKKREEENKKMEEERMRREKEEADKREKEEADKKEKEEAEKKMKEEGDKKNKQDSNKKKEESDKKKKEEESRKNDKVDKEKKNLLEEERKLEQEIKVGINIELRDRILKKVENKNRKRILIAERIDSETVVDDNDEYEYEVVTTMKKFKKTGN